MSMITNDWLTELGAEFRKPYYAKLYQFVLVTEKQVWQTGSHLGQFILLFLLELAL